jgi:hypothetical protein
VRRRDWRLRVTDVLAAVERIGRYTVGLDRAAFERDERTVEAVCFALVVCQPRCSDAGRRPSLASPHLARLLRGPYGPPFISRRWTP